MSLEYITSSDTYKYHIKRIHINMKLDAYLKYMLWMVIGLAFFFSANSYSKPKQKPAKVIGNT